jgi:hypothetical protein
MKSQKKGRVIFESDTEATATDQLAEQMEAALSIVFAQGKKIGSCQIVNNRIVIRFDDGTGLLISGQHLRVEELEIEDVPGFEEWAPETLETPEQRLARAERTALPPASSPPPLPRVDE